MSSQFEERVFSSHISSVQSENEIINTECPSHMAEEKAKEIHTKIGREGKYDAQSGNKPVE
jgi:hypothetical protein